MDSLPVDPGSEWLCQLSHTDGAAARYKCISQLARRNNINMLVNACDPDREGEAIFRRIISYAHANKPATGFGLHH